MSRPPWTVQELEILDALAPNLDGVVKTPGAEVLGQDPQGGLSPASTGPTLATRGQTPTTQEATTRGVALAQGSWANAIRNKVILAGTGAGSPEQTVGRTPIPSTNVTVVVNVGGDTALNLATVRIYGVIAGVRVQLQSATLPAIADSLSHPFTFASCGVDWFEVTIQPPPGTTPTVATIIAMVGYGVEAAASVGALLTGSPNGLHYVNNGTVALGGGGTITVPASQYQNGLITFTGTLAAGTTTIVFPNQDSVWLCDFSQVVMGANNVAFKSGTSAASPTLAAADTGSTSNKQIITVRGTGANGVAVNA